LPDGRRERNTGVRCNDIGLTVVSTDLGVTFLIDLAMLLLGSVSKIERTFEMRTVNSNAEELDQEHSEGFHTVTAK